MKIKAQITIFVIIGLLIVLIVMGVLYLNSRINDDTKVNPDVMPVYNFISDCLKTTSEDSIYYIGQTGGYYIKPKLSTNNNVAYYFIDDKSNMPELKDIENELSKYVKDMLFFCTKNFVDFPEYKVKQDEIKVNSFIEKGKVKFEVEFPITVTKDNKNYQFKKFSNVISVRLDVSYNVSKRLIEEQLKAPKDICLTCIEDLAKENEIVISAEDYDKDTVIFYILDEKSKINSKDYSFYFANKYKIG